MSYIECISKFSSARRKHLEERKQFDSSKILNGKVLSYDLDHLKTFFIMLLFSNTRRGNIFYHQRNVMIRAVPSITAKM